MYVYTYVCICPSILYVCVCEFLCNTYVYVHRCMEGYRYITPVVGQFLEFGSQPLLIPRAGRGAEALLLFVVVVFPEPKDSIVTYVLL